MISVVVCCMYLVHSELHSMLLLQLFKHLTKCAMSVNVYAVVC